MNLKNEGIQSGKIQNDIVFYIHIDISNYPTPFSVEFPRSQVVGNLEKILP